MCLTKQDYHIINYLIWWYLIFVTKKQNPMLSNCTAFMASIIMQFCCLTKSRHVELNQLCRIYKEPKKIRYLNWPQVLWGLVWCGTGLVWVQWVPWSPWDQEAQGGPTALEGPLVLDLLTQSRLMWVNWSQNGSDTEYLRLFGEQQSTFLTMWPQRRQCWSVNWVTSLF